MALVVQESRLAVVEPNTAVMDEWMRVTDRAGWAEVVKIVSHRAAIAMLQPDYFHRLLTNLGANGQGIGVVKAAIDLAGIPPMDVAVCSVYLPPAIKDYLPQGINIWDKMYELNEIRSFLRGE